MVLCNLGAVFRTVSLANILEVEHELTRHLPTDKPPLAHPCTEGPWNVAQTGPRCQGCHCDMQDQGESPDEKNRAHELHCRGWLHSVPDMGIPKNGR